MKLSTMAAVMTFISRLEEESAAFYEKQAEAFPELKNDFEAWARENRKFEKQVKQTYFGVITDTLESNFSFGDLDTDDFELDVSLGEGTEPPVIRAKALGLEETVRTFYLKAAESSEGLMADMPRLFRKLAKKREERFQRLR